MDPIADMLSCLKNAGYAGRELVSVLHSKEKMAVAEVLQRQGYVTAVNQRPAEPRSFIDIQLSYDEQGRPRIRGVKRVSRTSCRVYEKAKNIRSVKNGYGDAVLSTPKGVMTGQDARRENIGGEIMFNIW